MPISWLIRTKGAARRPTDLPVIESRSWSFSTTAGVQAHLGTGSRAPLNVPNLAQQHTGVSHDADGIRIRRT
jgi:hypothetical protein